MTQLDEIRIDETGTIDVRVVPDDDVSAEPYFLVVLPVGTRSYGPVQRYLLRLAKTIGCHDIVSVVHGGESEYTIRLRDGSLKVIDTSSDPIAADIVQALSGFVERSARARQVAKKVSAKFRGPAHGARQ